MVLTTTPGFYIGPLFIYYYGIVYALASLGLYILLLRKREQLGLSEKHVDTLVIHVLLGLLIGGRLMHFIVNQPSIFITDPLELLMFRHGGMSFFGALMGITCGVLLWYRTHSRKTPPVDKSQLFRLLDIGSLVASVAIIFGRLANFLNQELVGRIADPSVVRWCVEFSTASGCRHPYQLYAAASHLMLAIALILIWRSCKTRRSGITFLSFVTGYGALRFITDFWRDDPIAILGLTVWQLIAIAFAIVGGILLMRLIQRYRNGSDGYAKPTISHTSRRKA